MTESKLIGDWQYSYHDYFYPRYTSKLTFGSDGTFTKTEEYTASPNAPTVISTFRGSYTTNRNGIEPGRIALVFYDATATLDGETVASSADGGYTAICHFGFSESGNLLITEIVDGLSGHEKDPREVGAGKLVPSWEAYSRTKIASSGDSE